MILKERNPALQCHKDGCSSSAIQSGPFKMVNLGEHFPISDTGIKIRVSCYAMCSLANWTFSSCPKRALINILQENTSHLFDKTSVLQYSLAKANLTRYCDTNDAFVLTFLIYVILGGVGCKLKLEERESLVFCSG